MKNIIKKSLVIALCYYAIAIVGCDKKCPEITIGKYEFSELTVSNIAYNFEGDTAMAVEEYFSDSIDRFKFGIRYSLQYNAVAYNENLSFNLINTCCAKYVSCRESYHYSLDTVKEFSIITLNDLDDSHPSGSNVNDFFVSIHKNSQIRNLIRNAVPKIPNQSELIKRENGSGIDVGDIFFENLRTLGGINRTVAFEIRIEYTNGKILKTKTKTVFLK